MLGAEFRDQPLEFEINSGNFVREVNKHRTDTSWWENLLLIEGLRVFAEFGDTRKIQELQNTVEVLRNNDELQAANSIEDKISDLEAKLKKRRVVTVVTIGNNISRINKAIQRVDKLAEKHEGIKLPQASGIHTREDLGKDWLIYNTYLFGDLED